jgi:ribosome maturation factor RimP
MTTATTMEKVTQEFCIKLDAGFLIGISQVLESSSPGIEHFLVIYFKLFQTYLF